MDNSDNITSAQATKVDDTASTNVAVTQSNPAETPGRDMKGRHLCVTIGFILVLVGWLTMIISEWVSLGCTVVGLVFSCIGVRIPAGARRNLAITAIVAASVLLVVYALFASILILI